MLPKVFRDRGRAHPSQSSECIGISDLTSNALLAEFSAYAQLHQGIHCVGRYVGHDRCPFTGELHWHGAARFTPMERPTRAPEQPSYEVHDLTKLSCPCPCISDSPMVTPL